jgi:hypothetical protein
MAVSSDGNIYVLDDQAFTVRVFDAAGKHVRSFGRSGGGPGELAQPGGMLFLPDGRLVVRDPGNARMNVYSPDGKSVGNWLIPGNFFTSDPIYVDTAGHVYTDIIAERRGDGSWIEGLLELDSTGATVDTVRPPISEDEAPRLIATRTTKNGNSRSISSVPFWPALHVTMSPTGEYVGGNSARYAIHTWKADGKVQRIERAVEPVPVNSDEAAARVEQITRSMRNLDEKWNWSGPQPPSTKPFFKNIRVAEDGRIWVNISQPATKEPPDPDAKPDDKGRMPVDQWREPAVHDVFEADGTYRGSVAFPRRFTAYVMRGDQVWGTIRDELDVEYVVRMKVGTAGRR